ncbi:MAG: deoxyribodipyrimidine photo-lyase [Hyphomicrobiaceae bacterium]
MGPSIVVFSLDLRLSDHAALTAAAREGPVVPLFVLDETETGGRPMGGAGRWWLHGSLQALDQALRSSGSRLICRRGATVDVIRSVAKATEARSVRITRAYEPGAAGRESALKSALAMNGIGLHRHGGRLLFEPEQVRTNDGGPFKVFTAFWRAASRLDPPARPQGVPDLTPPDRWPASEPIERWDLAPKRPNWAAAFPDHWSPGEAGAEARLAAFIDSALRDYGDNRNRPDVVGTSRLSPHLHFGEISPRVVWHRIMAAAEADPRLQAGAEVYLREIGWREFSFHVLHHWPHLPESPFRPEFARFPWQEDADLLRAWQKGATGYPIVDAGLRELWQTGWMHNRVRMIAASVLVKSLLVPWQAGERWFWDTLVDADMANNAAGWQWVAGSGADAAPYFRIFNPVSQGRKFDPEGTYVRRWVPEIAGLPDTLVHAPFEATAVELEDAGIRLDRTYPRPIVDHKLARERALAAFATLKAGREG